MAGKSRRRRVTIVGAPAWGFISSVTGGRVEAAVGSRSATPGAVEPIVHSDGEL